MPACKTDVKPNMKMMMMMMMMMMMNDGAYNHFLEKNLLHLICL